MAPIEITRGSGSTPDPPKLPAQHAPKSEEKKPTPTPTPHPAAKPASAQDSKPAPTEKKHRTAKTTSADYFRANQGFATTLDGEPLFVAKGELVHKDHPLLEGRKEMFDPAENFGRFDVEQASAAPGEKRGGD